MSTTVKSTAPGASAASTTAPADPGDRVTKSGITVRDRTVIGVLLVAAFVVILNETIMSVAIPVLMRELRIDASTGQWLSTVFALTLAVVIPVTGFLIQRLTTRQLFAIALGLFSAGTLLAALAPGFPVLLVARIVQGCGTAVMIPLLMTTVITIVPEASRGRMMGNISVVISVAPALGPTISGVVLSLLSWRWMFWLVLPISIGALLLGLRLMKNVGEIRRVPIDVLSVPLAALGFGGLVYGLNTAGQAASGERISPLMIWLPVGVGAVALVLFLLRQVALQRSDRALLDLRAFRSRVFTAAVAAGGVAFLALLGSAILLPIYLQNVLRVGPLLTGLLVLPGGLVMGVLGPIVGRAYDRFGPRALLLPGTAVVAGSLALLGTVSETTPLWLVLVAHILLSVGLAAVLTPLFTAGLGAVPPAQASYGSAIFATVQQVGGAAGTALVVAVLAVQASVARSAGADALAAQASGVRSAFLVAAGISAAAFAISFFVTRPAGAPAVGAEPVHA